MMTRKTRGEALPEGVTREDIKAVLTMPPEDQEQFLEDLIKVRRQQAKERKDREERYYEQNPDCLAWGGDDPKAPARQPIQQRPSMPLWPGVLVLIGCLVAVIWWRGFIKYLVLEVSFTGVVFGGMLLVILLLSAVNALYKWCRKSIGLDS